MKSGPTFSPALVNSMGELCLATPAIANDMLLVRTNKHLFAIGK